MSFSEALSTSARRVLAILPIHREEWHVPIGQAVRKLLGPRLMPYVAKWYRAIFIDLRKEAEALSSVLPRGAHLLDVGGGDGEPLNPLLALRPDLKITTLDPLVQVGQWIEERFLDRVTRLPRTSLEQFLESGREVPDAILIADVMHHIHKSQRPVFLASVQRLLERAPKMRIIVKDVEPGSWRAVASYLADHYITGDRNVSLVSRDHLVTLLHDALGPLRREDTSLFDIDKPNYAILFTREDSSEPIRA